MTLQNSSIPKKRTKPRIEIDLAKVEEFAQTCDSEELQHPIFATVR